MLSGLALENRPLDDPDKVVGKLQVEAIDGQIKVLQREVASLDPDAEPEAYSERFAELIALERQRRDVRSEE